MHEIWSPTYNVLFKQLTVFQETLRRLCGQHGRERWRTNTQKQQGILKFIKHWQSAPDAYKYTNKEKEDLLNRTGKSPQYWITANESNSITPRVINQEIRSIKKKMHARQRGEDRKQMKDAIAEREVKRISGKLKKVLNSMVNQQINTYDMETLNLDINNLVQSSAMIHKQITEWFSKWFTMERQGVSIHTTKDWEKCYND